jgi:hypothetical protein
VMLGARAYRRRRLDPQNLLSANRCDVGGSLDFLNHRYKATFKDC